MPALPPNTFVSCSETAAIIKHVQISFTLKETYKNKRLLDHNIFGTREEFLLSVLFAVSNIDTRRYSLSQKEECTFLLSNCRLIEKRLHHALTWFVEYI
jgi:hypothetical protein